MRHVLSTVLRFLGRLTPTIYLLNGYINTFETVLFGIISIERLIVFDIFKIPFVNTLPILATAIIFTLWLGIFLRSSTLASRGNVFLLRLTQLHKPWRLSILHFTVWKWKSIVVWRWSFRHYICIYSEILRTSYCAYLDWFVNEYDQQPTYLEIFLKFKSGIILSSFNILYSQS